jgi:hypothetical protein
MNCLLLSFIQSQPTHSLVIRNQANYVLQVNVLVVTVRPIRVNIFCICILKGMTSIKIKKQGNFTLRNTI